MTDLYARLAETIEDDWTTRARPNQLPPAGDWWLIWLLLAGRGFGKTRTLTEWLRMLQESGAAGRMALVGATASDCRDVLIEGPAGLLTISPKWNRPTYEPTKRRLTWPNGAIATCFSADEPERLRGPQHDAAVCDELASWRYPEALDMLLFGLRLGAHPRCAIATTPKPIRLVRELLAREGNDVVVTRGSTFENADNLSPAFIKQVRDRYEGTRLGRQELHAEVLEDTPGALWNRDNLEATRVAEAPTMQRVVVAIDPAGSSEEGADITGIVVAGLGADGHGYVLDDLSGRYQPTEWARRALGAYHVWKADRLITEINYGGEMCAATIAAVDASVPVKTISSSRGKVLRAEPVAAFFEQRRAHIVGSQPELEDQACRFTADWSRTRDGSPDRVDAMVFALTELLLTTPPGGFFKEASLLDVRKLPENTGVLDTVPIDMPQFVTGCYAVVGTMPNSDAVAVIYFANCKNASAPLVVLDWDLWQFDAVGMQAWIAGVSQRLAALRQECRATFARDLIFIDQMPIGAGLIAQGQELGLSVIDIAACSEVAPDLEKRAHAVGRHVGAGRVKVARYAHEKTTTFGGITRNHLLAQILSFGIGLPQTQSSELLYAFTTGVYLKFERK